MADERPVEMMSRSIIPVLGSVADLRVALSISVTASSTSSSVTSCERRIFAKASLSLIRDSNCRGVAVMVFLLIPIARRDMYSFANFFPAASLRIGWQYSRAYVMYLANSCCENGLGLYRG